MRAIMDRIFLKLEPKEEKKGSLIVLETYHQSRNIGTVLSVGEQVHCVKVGDKVIFHDFDELESPEPDVVVIREHSLLGIIDD